MCLGFEPGPVDIRQRQNHGAMVATQVCLPLESTLLFDSFPKLLKWFYYELSSLGSNHTDRYLSPSFVIPKLEQLFFATNPLKSQRF